jgi:hypothetical protein
MSRASYAKEFQIKVGDNLGAGADLFTKLRDAGIDVMASCCYQIGDQAHLSFVPTKAEGVEEALEKHKLTTEPCDVLVVEIPNHSGAFAKILGEIASLGIQVRSAYVSPTETNAGLAVVKTDDNDRVLEELNRQPEEDSSE